MRGFIIFVFFLVTSASYGQYLAKLKQSRMLAVQDTILLENNSIQTKDFGLTGVNSIAVDTSKYTIDFAKAILLSLIHI